MPKRPQYWTIDALDPFDASGCGTIALRLNCEHTDGLRMMNLDARYARIMLIPEVVRRPRIVLKGWRREGFEQALIYVGRPERDYRSPTIETPPPKGMVFCVFVTPETHMISDWRWERADARNADYPENVSERCEGIIWPTNLQT